jgi:Asp-tRNA(Asn)/Glu-tRNA(Gln) amidotransferase A subunit family amidase
MRSRQASPVEVVAAHLRRIDEINPSLNAIVTIAPDAIDRARAAEEMIASGNEVGALAGLPVTVKDTIDTAGLLTTSGSGLRAAHVPQRDAPVVARLIAAGAIILGKTNTPEMAIPYETDNQLFGRTNHPEDPTRTPGGSSGGEAAAIAAHLSPAGIGSDLSGSIRVPAHFCGIAGLKPTTGLVPMAGHIPEATGTLALSAAIGPMARRVADLDLLLRVISDAPSSLSLDESIGKLAGLRAAWYVADEISPVTEATAEAVRTAAKILQQAGLETLEELPPSISEGQRLWVELFSKPSRQQLADRYRGREVDAGPIVSQSLGTSASTTFEDRINMAEGLAKAVVERERLREALLRWTKNTALILAPVAATPAFEHGAKRVEVEGTSISVFRACSYAQTFNVFGFPAVVVPVLRSPERLPIGIQVVAAPGNDQLALAAAAIIEQSAQFS